MDHDARLRTDRPTSRATAELDDAGAARYRFDFAGTSAEHLEPAAALAALPPGAAALRIGGLGLVLEPLAFAIEAMARVQGRSDHLRRRTSARRRCLTTVGERPMSALRHGLKVR